SSTAPSGSASASGWMSTSTKSTSCCWPTVERTPASMAPGLARCAHPAPAAAAAAVRGRPRPSRSNQARADVRIEKPPPPPGLRGKGQVAAIGACLHQRRGRRGHCGDRRLGLAGSALLGRLLRGAAGGLAGGLPASGLLRRRLLRGGPGGGLLHGLPGGLLRRALAGRLLRGLAGGLLGSRPGRSLLGN